MPVLALDAKVSRDANDVKVNDAKVNRGVKAKLVNDAKVNRGVKAKLANDAKVNRDVKAKLANDAKVNRDANARSIEKNARKFVRRKSVKKVTKNRTDAETRRSSLRRNLVSHWPRHLGSSDRCRGW